MSLKTLKGKIRSIDKTRTVTKAMEAVSAAKMRKSQERALSARPYSRSALRILQKLSGSIDAINHPLTISGSGTRILVVLITSDKGLAGNLNSAVLKQLTRFLKEQNVSIESADFIAIGRKGAEFVKKRGFTVLLERLNDQDSVSIEDLSEVRELLSQKYLTGAYKEVIALYQNFRSTFENEPAQRSILPIQTASVREAVLGITPSKGKFAEAQEEESIFAYTIEPDPESVLNELMPFLLSVLLFHALLESKAAEHSARMVAMKNASDKALELSDALRLEFNKARQALITREVSEITSGIEAMN